MTARPELHIRRWLFDLAIRCAPRSAENLEVIIEAFASDLADLPAAVFCEAARQDASRKWEYFPPYAVLRAFLEQWWEEHRPHVALLPGIDDSELHDEDRQWAKAWLRYASGDWGTDRKSGEAFHGSQRDLRMRLERMRKHRPAAFRWLVLHNQEAARIAALAGWRDDPVSSAAVDKLIGPHWAGITEEQLRAYVRAYEGLGPWLGNAFLDGLRAALGRYAPHMVGFVPERYEKLREQKRSVDDQLSQLSDAERAETNEALAAHVSKPMTPDQVRAMRAKAGITGLPDPQPQPPPPKPDPLFPWERQC